MLLETVDGTGPGNTWQATHVAATARYLVFAAELFAYGWKERGQASLQRVSPFFEFIEDLDAFEDRYAVLGLHRRKDGEFAPDGYIGWTGRLGPEPTEPQPLMRSISGPGAPLMENCPTFGIGALRFLRDGSLIVVPGSENGAFLYEPAGKLISTWDTEALGIGADCTFDMEKERLLAGNLQARWDFLSHYRTVDEILILDGIPTLVVRRVQADGTRWELVTLEPDGRTSRRDLPITSPSRLGRIRGDTRDGRTVLLVYDWARFIPDDEMRENAVPTRLVILESSTTHKAAE